VTSDKATVALVVELRSIAQSLEAKPVSDQGFTLLAEELMQHIKVVATLAADALEEAIHAA
jgi:hypothetical protein